MRGNLLDGAARWRRSDHPGGARLSATLSANCPSVGDNLSPFNPGKKEKRLISQALVTGSDRSGGGSVWESNPPLGSFSSGIAPLSPHQKRKGSRLAT